VKRLKRIFEKIKRKMGEEERRMTVDSEGLSVVNVELVNSVLIVNG